MNVYGKDMTARDLADLLDDNEPMHSLTGLASVTLREQSDRIDALTLMLQKSEAVAVSLFEGMELMNEYVKLRGEK